MKGPSTKRTLVSLTTLTFLILLDMSPTLLALKLNGQESSEPRHRSLGALSQENEDSAHRSNPGGGGGGVKGELVGGLWPPSIPMWSFLPASSSANKKVGPETGGGSMSGFNLSPHERDTFLRDNQHQHHHHLSFLPNPVTPHHDPEEEERNSHRNDIPLHRDESWEEAEDISSLLSSSSARRLNNLKRSSSISYSIAESRKSDDVKRSRPYDVPQIGKFTFSLFTFHVYLLRLLTSKRAVACVRERELKKVNIWTKKAFRTHFSPQKLRSHAWVLN